LVVLLFNLFCPGNEKDAELAGTSSVYSHGVRNAGAFNEIPRRLRIDLILLKDKKE
jgi:hypothetical protein